MYVHQLLQVFEFISGIDQELSGMNFLRHNIGSVRYKQKKKTPIFDLHTVTDG